MSRSNYSFESYNVADLDLELSEQDLPHVDDYPIVHEEWLERGYKISQLYNADTGGFCLTLTGRNTGIEDDGHVMSVWASSIGKATQKLAYLVDLVSEKKGFMVGKSLAEQVHKERMRMIRDKLGLK